MPDNVLVDTAQAVTDAVNGGTYSQTINAVRSYAQWQTKFDVAEKDGLRVDVVPVSKLDAELEARGSIAWSPRTDVVVRFKFPPGQLTEDEGKPKTPVVDALVLLVQEIFSSLVARRIGAGDQACWEDEDILASYMPSHLRDKQQFTGVIRVTHAVQTDLA